MLQSDTKMNESFNDFNTLDLKMEQCLEGLNLINLMVTKNKKFKNNIQPVENDRLKELELNCTELQTQLDKVSRLLEEKEKSLQILQQQADTLQETYEKKLNSDIQLWRDRANNSQKDFDKLTKEHADLLKSKTVLDTKIKELQGVYDKQFQDKEQLELVLKESMHELEIIAENLLERDQKLDENQQTILRMQKMMSEKDTLLKNYDKEAQTSSKELKQLLDKLDELEKENFQLKSIAPIEDDNLLSVHNELSDNDVMKSEPVKNLKTSRIPIPTNQRSTAQNDTQSTEITKLREELLVCQQKLMEKTTQNKELESAMTRVNDHCDLMRENLYKANKESAARYTKILELMDENRVLKEELSNYNKDYF